MPYYVFDRLHLDGVSTLDLPYTRRRELLDSLGCLPELASPPGGTGATPEAGPADTGAQPPGTAGPSQRGVSAALIIEPDPTVRQVLLFIRGSPV
ncbi:hypothetical protein GCM10010399_64420 [Dactylosporangium fulvum]|uniref:Uncharacterized protein n=1 Tax=Dactylosporangium fulvum TaxID=53359 RepID=A0ABY5W6U6_9ACTN|nr:hypothetical protein [Dactylosporangium fulvum]UWP85735.1 hypothetical protein Dfulv_16435 [Dactylosporangium fulvum]